MTYGMNMLLWSGDVTGDEFLPIFERLKKMGFDTVETPVFDVQPARFEQMGKRLREMGLGHTASTALTPDKHLISDDDAMRRKAVDFLKAAVDCTHALGSKLLIGPIFQGLGVFSGSAPTDTEWKRAVESLREVAVHAAQADVTLAIEPLNRFEVYLINSVADGVRFVHEVDHPHLKLMYDSFHANIEEKSITKALELAAPDLVHVQLSENDRSTPGKGGVNWKETFDAFKSIGYDQSFTLEAFGQGVPELAAATKIWRKMFESEEKLAEEGLAFVKSERDIR